MCGDRYDVCRVIVKLVITKRYQPSGICAG